MGICKNRWFIFGIPKFNYIIIYIAVYTQVII